MASFEIRKRRNDETDLIVHFDDIDEAGEAIENLIKLNSLYEIKILSLELRVICQTDDGVVFYPADGKELPKGRWMVVAAAASYPNGVPHKIIEMKGQMTYKVIRAFCTSANNPTSEYLFIEEDRVHILPEGIPWVMDLLVKDKQIQREQK